MVNKKAQVLIAKIQKDVTDNGINVEQLVTDFKALREFAIQEQIPRLVKCLRYTYEHLEEYDGFFIPQPEDELVDEEGEVIGVIESATDNDKDSLLYLLSIISDAHNKMNHEELKEYNTALREYADNN